MHTQFLVDLSHHTLEPLALGLGALNRLETSCKCFVYYIATPTSGCWFYSGGIDWELQKKADSKILAISFCLMTTWASGQNIIFKAIATENRPVAYKLLGGIQ